MSTLWTPGGEVPIDRDAGRSDAADAARPTAAGPEPGPGPTSGDPASDDPAARAEELQRFLRETPAADVVAEHAMGLYELAVIHLSQERPALAEARLAVDALSALVDGLEGRLGRAEPQLRQVLPQLKMAYVQLADRANHGEPGGPDSDISAASTD